MYQIKWKELILKVVKQNFGYPEYVTPLQNTSNAHVII